MSGPRDEDAALVDELRAHLFHLRPLIGDELARVIDELRAELDPDEIEEAEKLIAKLTADRSRARVVSR